MQMLKQRLSRNEIRQDDLELVIAEVDGVLHVVASSV